MIKGENIELYNLINDSYQIIVGKNKDNKISNLLNLTDKDLNIIYGAWFITCIHFLLKIGTTKNLNYSYFKINNDSKNEFSLEQDFLFKIYFLKSCGLYKEYTYKSVRKFVDSNSFCKHINREKYAEISTINKNDQIKKKLNKNIKEVIYYLRNNLKNNYFNNKRVEFIIKIINYNIPIVLNKKTLISYTKYLLKNNKFKLSTSMYGMNLRANILCSKGYPIITKQHGIQEGLIKYNPHTFYIDKSEIEFKFFNNLIYKNKRNYKKNYLYWLRLFKYSFEYLDFSKKEVFKAKDKNLRNIVIFCHGAFPGQIPINEKKIFKKTWEDITYFCNSLNSNFNIIIRPRYDNIEITKNYLYELGLLKNVYIDYERVYKIKCGDIVLCNSFSSAILERTFGKGKIILYLPEYFVPANTNRIGNKFFKKTNLKKVIFKNRVTLAIFLNSGKYLEKRNLINKFYLKIKLLSFLIL